MRINVENKEVTFYLDNGKVQTYFLPNGINRFERMLLEIIEELSELGPGALTVKSWALADSTEKIPIDQIEDMGTSVTYDIGEEPGDIPIIQEDGQLAPGIVTFETIVPAGSELIINGGKP